MSENGDRATGSAVEHAAGGSDRLRIAVLGEVTVTAPDRRSIQLRPAERRLLAILVLSDGRTVPTDVLIDRMWAGTPPATARAALQAHVAGLRRRTAADIVITEPTGYRLHDERTSLDTTRFRELSRRARQAHEHGAHQRASELAQVALDLWRGDPFRELLDDEYSLPDRAELEELHLNILELWAEASLRAGAEERVASRLEGLATSHPERERLWEHLIVARHRLGRHEEAVRAFRDVEERLAERGLVPTDRFRELEGLVLRHDDSLASDARPTPWGVVASTSFVGRADDLVRVPELVGEHRLVTLVGAGGVGKTRLCLELLRRGQWDAVFVDLTSTGVDGITAYVAAAAGITVPEDRDGSDEVVFDQLVASMGRSPRLLVLDNCEHVVEAVAVLVGRLLEHTTDLVVLATSREPLHVRGERQYRLRSLTTTPGDLDAEAVRLFVERAKDVRATFDPSAEERAEIATLCRHLDGLPLAIEFAAARCSHLSIPEIAGRLGDRFSLLRSTTRNVPRHETMLAVLEWSHDLLESNEQVLLRRLAVFADSFSMDFVERVCTDAVVSREEAVDVVAGLVDKSLVVAAHEPGRPVRYRLLESVRAFALSRLDETDERPDLVRRHAARYLEWLESRPWGQALSDAAFATAMVREFHNIRAALACLAGAGDLEAVGRLAARSHLLWSPTVGHAAEGRRWIDIALGAPGLSPETRAACLVVRALAGVTLGSADQERDAEAAIATGQQLDGYILEAWGIFAMGPAQRAAVTTDPDLQHLAYQRLELYHAEARRCDAEHFIGYAHVYEAQTAMLLRDLERAIAAFDHLLSLPRLSWMNRRAAAPEIVACRYLTGDLLGAIEAADRLRGGQPVALAMRPMRELGRAVAAAALGRNDEARASLRAALSAADRDRFLEVNACLTYAAVVRLEWGEPEAAAMLLGASTTFGGAERVDYRFRNPCVFLMYLHARDRLREQLDDATRRAARSRGRALTDSEALQLLDDLTVS